MSAFANLKKNRGNLDKLREQLETVSGAKKDYTDDRFWYPDVDDKTGNGYAVVRFLPTPEQDGDPEKNPPIVRYWDHSFQGPTGNWYIELSRTSINGPDGKPHKDPCTDFNNKLWNSGVEGDRDIARKQKRKLNYVANVLVVEDPEHPENNGKVFLFKFGKQIFDVLYAAQHPEFPDEKPIDPFDLWEGANFKIKIRNKDGYRNYSSSEFEAPTQLFKDESEMEQAWKQCHSLKELVDPTNFKTYEQLQARLDLVLGLNEARTQISSAMSHEEEVPASHEESSPPWNDDVVFETPEEDVVVEVDTTDEEDIDFFKELASK